MPLWFAEDLEAEVREALGYRCAEDAILDPRGRTVRCTPGRRTLRWRMPDGTRIYRKVCSDGGALTEWRWLCELARLGFRVPGRVFVASAGGLSAVGTLGVSGRPMDAWLAEVAGTAEASERLALAARLLAPLVRRMHELGLFHRDLYLGHLFVEDARHDSVRDPVLLDVGRVLRPRLRRRRWVVKDLASLLSSCPLPCPVRLRVRFLHSYLGALPPGWRRLGEAIDAKAARIRAHRPRFG